MREIKFRAIDKALNIWVFGNLVQGLDLDGNAFCQIEVADANQHRIYQVHPESVCEFTSFQVKNEDLFEGHLLQNPEGKIGAIVFREGAFVMEGKNKKGGLMWFALTAGFLHNKTIVGSAFDNPELIA